MIFKKYILTNFRFMMNNRLLSILKLFSLTAGTLSFLLIWLFYIDSDLKVEGASRIVMPCSLEGVLLLLAVLAIMVVVYLILICDQIAMRTKELFFRKYYGASTIELITLIMTEAVLFLIVAFLISLVLIDQLTPLFNRLTERQVNLSGNGTKAHYILNAFLFMIPGFIIMLMPAIRCARHNASALLRKMQ